MIINHNNNKKLIFNITMKKNTKHNEIYNHITIYKPIKKAISNIGLGKGWDEFIW